MQALRMEWALMAALSLAFLAGGYSLLSLAWQSDLAARWLPLPFLVIAYLLAILWRNLDLNIREGEQEVLPDLGWGNRLTLLRGLLVAGMVGFLTLPRPEGWLIWVPGILYCLSDATDFFDGYVARLTNHATRLGKFLEMSFDGLGVLAASLLVVLYGQAPAWYVLVGLARYLFVFGEWLRRRLGKPIYPVPPSLYRRVFAALQMGFLAVALLPLIPPPGIHIAATLFGLPLLAGFGRDWLYVTGVIKSNPERKAGIKAWIMRWMPVGLRLIILAINLSFITAWFAALQANSLAFILIGLLYCLSAMMLVLGALPRVASVIALAGLGLAQLLAPLTIIQIGLGVAYILILYLGSGAFSLWAPEEHLVYHSIGQRQAKKGGQVRMKGWRALRWLVWLALPVVLVWLIRSIPFGDIRDVLVSINPLALIGLIAFNAFVMVVFSSRWWLALRAQGYRLGYWSVFRYRMAAFAISYFTPGTQFGGEPLQVYTVSSRHAVPAPTAIASVTLDKLFELLANFSFLVVGLLVILRKQLIFNLSSGLGTFGAAGLLVVAAGLPDPVVVRASAAFLARSQEPAGGCRLLLKPV